MDKPTLRDALQAAREFASGWQYAGKQWDEAQELVQLVDEALADDAARGTMREAFDAWLIVRESGRGYPADLWEAWQAATRAAATPEPIYAKSVVRRLATQMGWKPPGAAAPQSVEPVADLTEWVAKAMRLADNLVMTRGHSAAKADFRAHLSTMPQEEGWRPIETAPTGKVHSPPLHAIVASPLDDGSLYVEEAWFDNERREWWPANVEFTDAHGSAIYPTHWRPLPEPPKGGE